jgi:hypothetical protein
MDGSEILKMLLMLVLRGLLTVTHYTQVVIQATSKWEGDRKRVQGEQSSKTRIGDSGRRNA